MTRSNKHFGTIWIEMFLKRREYYDKTSRKVEQDEDFINHKFLLYHPEKYTSLNLRTTVRLEVMILEGSCLLNKW